MSSIPIYVYLIAIISTLLMVLVLQIISLFRKVLIKSKLVREAVEEIEDSYERSVQSVREEFGRNREETSHEFRSSREETANMLKNMGDTVGRQIETLTLITNDKLERFRNAMVERFQSMQSGLDRKLDHAREETLASAKGLRDEVGFALKSHSEALVNSTGEMSSLQQRQLNTFSDRLDKLTQTNDQRLETMREVIEQRLGNIQEDSGKKLDQMRNDSSIATQKAREEVTISLKEFRETLSKTLIDIAGQQKSALDSVLAQLAKLTETTENKLEGQKVAIDDRLQRIQRDGVENAREMREDVSKSLKVFNESVTKLTEANQERMEVLKTAVEEKLSAIQADNAKQLDQMRATVDEKLQGTLEKRLGESFKQVSDRLEQVYKGLGEMQTLASGVGDLKKVLTNVKTRGTWGEVQLGAMLEEVLNPDQFARNVATKDGGERVEFAVKLPGRNEDEHEVVWLPIDAKFPIEDYQRILDAQERADSEMAEITSRQLENRIKQSAADICRKYLNPPRTTDFAILFLPTEGLFAEAIRRPALAESIQRECRVLIAGPTTLWSILNSLQMGFRTLAIQKRSSEVWNLLAAVKTEWSKYGDVLKKVQKKLHEASITIESAQTRTRAIGRKLRSVQELPAVEAQAMLSLENEKQDSEVEVKEI